MGTGTTIKTGGGSGKRSNSSGTAGGTSYYSKNQNSFSYGRVLNINKEDKSIVYTPMEDRVGDGGEKKGIAYPFFGNNQQVPSEDNIVPLVIGPARFISTEAVNQYDITTYYLDPVNFQGTVNANTTGDGDNTKPTENSYKKNELGFGGPNVKYNQTNFKAESGPAKTAAETYLGRIMTDEEWNQLVRATYAESSPNQTERGYIMAVMLNRVRSRKWGATVTSVLTAKSQFQAVTGTSKNGRQPSKNYTTGPNSENANNIYGAATNILLQVPKDFIYFTAANRKAYKAGTNVGFLDTLLAKGGITIGKTVFGKTA